MATNGSSEILPVIPLGIALITGPTMLGILLNWGFMGILVAQIYYYYSSFPDDAKTIKALVYGLGLLDTLQTAMVTADAFHWFVFGFGNMNQLNDTFLNSWDVPFLDSIISSIVQGFYCWRIYVLRNNSVILPAIIFTISLTQCGAGIATAIIAHRLGELSLISTEVVEQTIWLVGGVVADVLITVVLTWTLLKTRGGELRSNSMLGRIVRLTVETNSLTAGVAIISVVLFLAVPQHSTLVVPPTAIMAKLYTNCLVAVLNSRELRSNIHSFGGNTASSNGTNSNLARSTLRLGENARRGQAQVKVSVLEETDMDYIELENVGNHDGAREGGKSGLSGVV